MTSAGMVQILTYVGSIIALLLFSVMLSPPDREGRKMSRRETPSEAAQTKEAYLSRHTP